MGKYVNLKKIALGTILIGWDGFSHTLAKVISYQSDDYGDFLRCQPFNTKLLENAVYSVGDENMKGIGWKIATKEEINLYN